jgi:hypothetical protein
MDDCVLMLDESVKYNLYYCDKTVRLKPEYDDEDTHIKRSRSYDIFILKHTFLSNLIL